MSITEQINTLKGDIAVHTSETIEPDTKVLFIHPVDIGAAKEIGCGESVAMRSDDLIALAESHERLLKAAKAIAHKDHPDDGSHQDMRFAMQCQPCIEFKAAIAEAEQLNG